MGVIERAFKRVSRLKDSYFRGKGYRGLRGLDRKVFRIIRPEAGGFFIEAGANDGVTQSNSFFLEKKLSWTGLMVEPVPRLAEVCTINRPNSIVLNAALVAPSDAGTRIPIVDVDLMSVVNRPSDITQASEETILEAEDVQGISRNHVYAEGRTLTSILEEVEAPPIDFFSLDVEGFELEVLKGLDIKKYAPKWILIETHSYKEVSECLGEEYVLAKQITHHDYLFRYVPSSVISAFRS